MKDGFIKIACATPKLKVADCDYNTEQIIALIRKAQKRQLPRRRKRLRRSSRPKRLRKLLRKRPQKRLFRRLLRRQRKKP